MQTRKGIVAFSLFLAGFWALLAGALLAKGGFYIGKHEGDTIHLADLVLRQAAGEWAHLDYMTPIGVLATAPMAFFAAQGMGLGMSILAAQAAVGALLLVPIWWIGVTRLQAGWAMLYGAICLVMTMALVHGEPLPGISISMHYNRWAWVLSFLAIATVLLPPQGRGTGRAGRVADGLILGLCVAGLALIKVTYVAAFLPAILAGLLIRRDWRALKTALVAGLLVILLLTILAGPGFWLAYFGDMISVATEGDRLYPQASLTGVIIAPAYLGGSFLAIFSVILLRQCGRQEEGLILLLLVPGFFYATFQNFGNDPQWMYLLGVLMLALRPEPGVENGWGWNMRLAVTLAACAAFALSLPSALNLTFSPFRHLALNPAEYDLLLPAKPEHDDIFFAKERNERPYGEISRPLAGADLEDPPVMLLGEQLPVCALERGTVTYLDAVGREIEAAGFAGRAIYHADLMSGIWLFGDFQRLHGAAPWRYSGLPGFEEAEFLLVSFCPIVRVSRDGILSEVAKTGVGLAEVYRGDDFLLLEIQRP
ncbi:hypothetical protein [Aliiruegeria sabulilitoris]|uniref:hypothetical protein n=1 Tax=Aliiruegeria sabulilitoris TaxID=1510458 RepID=UPI00083096A4|nr:hypothetical protein [Aliiruegeria sabulilitoris]NDR55956.1 hypothetical protein [Pseudoruegeria sp. M32A2M]